MDNTGFAPVGGVRGLLGIMRLNKDLSGENEEFEFGGRGWT